PASGCPADPFSRRWTRSVYVDSGNYRFRIWVDEGMRVYLDGNLIIDEWRDGSEREVARDLWIDAGWHTVRVEYYENMGDARAKIAWERISEPSDFPDWKGEYWPNRGLDGSPAVVRNDREIDFNWGTGSPDSRIPSDNFSARWTRRITFEAGRYRFYARADDGVRVYVDDNRIINEWHDSRGDELYT
ncbi:hypothetical protein RY27_15175, partial [Litorilinea aerophila]